MKKIMILLIIIFIAIPSGLLAKEKNELVICTWGGDTEKAMREAFFNPFEKSTGVKVISVTFPNLAKIKAMVQTGNVEWDIVTTGGSIYWASIKQGLLEKIDYKYFDKKTLDELFPEVKEPYGVGAYCYSVVMTYSTKAYSKENHPRNWVEFWDVKRFPGPRTLISVGTAGTGWEVALLADSVPKDKLYKDPDLNRAFGKFKEIKPHVVKWWTSGAVPGQLFVDNEVVLGNAYSARIQLLKEQGAAVDYIWNDGWQDVDTFFIPKGAPNYENALKFINFAVKPDRQAHFSKLYAYGPVNQKAFDLLPLERARILPSYPENKEKQFLRDQTWYMDNTERAIELWNNWILVK